jgi:predicted GNAT family acetyltransferase
MGIEVRDVPGEERYEISRDGMLAGFAEYRGGAGTTRAFTHTEIDPAFGGQGLASELIAFALDDARAHGMRVLPVCPFVQSFLADHPAYLDLVEPNIRRAFRLPEPP